MGLRSAPMPGSISHLTAVLAASCAIALLAGCGDSNDRSQPADDTPIPSATADLPNRTVPRPASAFRGQDRVNYINSKRDCRATGVRSIGETYETEGPGRIRAARAYAGNRFTPAYRQAAYEGCLAGFRK
jgi:hypothetical protein